MGESIGFRDKILTCVDCKQEFAFTASEQEYFVERGIYSNPKRCQTCDAVFRSKQRNRDSNDSDLEDSSGNLGGENDDDNRGGNDCNDGIPVTWGPRPFKLPPPPDQNRKECGDNEGNWSD